MDALNVDLKLIYINKVLLKNIEHIFKKINFGWEGIINKISI